MIDGPLPWMLSEACRLLALGDADVWAAGDTLKVEAVSIARDMLRDIRKEQD